MRAVEQCNACKSQCVAADFEADISRYMHRLRDAAPEFAAATCLALACPACMTLELAQSCSGYVTTIINNTDVVPTISPGTMRLQKPECVWQDNCSCAAWET